MVEHERVPLDLRHPQLGAPSDFEDSPDFDHIKDPGLDFQHYADQRLIPWEGAGELTEDERGIYVVTAAERPAGDGRPEKD